MKDYLIVTGASKGFGHAVSIKMADKLDVVGATLVSRSSMSTVAQSLESKIPVVHAVNADLSDLASLDASIDRILSTTKPQLFDRIIFVNNAANLGHVGPATKIDSLTSLRESVDFNLTSSLWMSVCVSRLPGKKLIINVSSLLAIDPFPSMSVYSCIKAARDSFAVAMAKEGAVETLNYAPGPLETDMANELRNAEDLDESIKPHYAKVLIDPTDSAGVLVDIVASGSYSSGDHIDYYDVKKA